MGKARLEVKQADLAVNHYRFVLDKGQPKEIRVIARERLARLLLDQGQAAEALELIQGQTELAGFEARYAETRGDIFLALGREQEAIAAYQEALDALEPGMGDRNTLELKIESLGVVKPDEVSAS
jgi:predicted negative regulator of RcsB-dependent stress response